MTELRQYRRRYPLYVRARYLQEGEVVYDLEGRVLQHKTGDALIELAFDRFTLDRLFFDSLYEEVTDESDTEPVPPDIRRSPERQDGSTGDALADHGHSDGEDDRIRSG